MEVCIYHFGAGQWGGSLSMRRALRALLGAYVHAGVLVGWSGQLYGVFLYMNCMGCFLCINCMAVSYINIWRVREQKVDSTRTSPVVTHPSTTRA